MPRPVAIIIVVLLSGCPPSKPQPTETAWQLVLQQVQKDGTVSVDTARAAFSLAFGPLPGVSRPPGKDSVIGDGTIASRWMDAHAGELTAEELEIAEMPCEAAPTTNAMVQASYESQVNNASMTIAAALGITPLSIGTVVNENELVVSEKRRSGTPAYSTRRVRAGQASSRRAPSTSTRRRSPRPRTSSARPCRTRSFIAMRRA